MCVVLVCRLDRHILFASMIFFCPFPSYGLVCLFSTNYIYCLPTCGLSSSRRTKHAMEARVRTLLSAKQFMEARVRTRLSAKRHVLTRAICKTTDCPKALLPQTLLEARLRHAFSWHLWLSTFASRCYSSSFNSRIHSTTSTLLAKKFFGKHCDPGHGYFAGKNRRHFGQDSRGECPGRPHRW